MQHNWTSAFTVLVWLLSLACARQAIAVVFGMRRLVDLRTIDASSLADLPSCVGHHLTVIVPACNEERCIGTTLSSLASSTGIQLQIIAVDDRSADRTGKIMDHFALNGALGNRSHSVEVLHNGNLPNGWLGKTHAMHSAVEFARTPWLLFTDADVTFAPEALERAMRCAMTMNADHFVLVPSLIARGISEGAMLALIQSLTQLATRYWKVAESESKDFLGLGGFNLIRTDVYRSLGGFSRLRMEVIEDMSLGWMVKRGGYRSIVATGLGLVKIRWIDGLFGIVRNVEKNGFSLFRYREWFCVLACLGILIGALAPLVGMVSGGWALAGGLMTYLAMGLIVYGNRRLNGINVLAVLLFAPCASILCFAFVRSMVLTLRNRGITWRGTHYTLSELRGSAASWK